MSNYFIPTVKDTQKKYQATGETTLQFVGLTTFSRFGVCRWNADSSEPEQLQYTYEMKS